MNENQTTMTIEIERELYAQASELFQSLGTTIEDIAATFIKFCIVSDVQFAGFYAQNPAGLL